MWRLPQRTIFRLLRCGTFSLGRPSLPAHVNRSTAITEIRASLDSQPTLDLAFTIRTKSLSTATVDRVPDLGYNEYNLVYALLMDLKGRNVLMKGDANFCVE